MSLIKFEKKIIISFEGIDGSGKTTIAKHTEQELKKMNFPVLYTEEPTNSSIGKIIREVVLSANSVQLTPFAQALLFTADRSYHVNTVIFQAIKDKKIVILDRFIDSTLAYQGENEEILDLIAKINEVATESIQPDITFLLDIEPELALKRLKNISKKKDSFEKLDILTNVRKRYKSLAEKNRERIKILDALLEIETLVKLVINDILKMIDQKNIYS